MDREKVAKLEELLKQKIGDDRKITSTKISRLTAPGDNYGGLLLKVDIILEDTEGAKEDLHVVAKTIPVNIFLQEVFNIQVSVKKEIAIYDTIVPLLQEFQREKGLDNVMDFFPKLYGARLNLNGRDVVDENSAIIMENLVYSGYKNVARSVGFDLETTRLILKDVATFHSTCLAFKIAKPEVFEKKIEPYLTPMKPPPPPPTNEDGHTPAGPNDVLQEFLNHCEEPVRSLRPKLDEILKFGFGNEEKNTRPFFTANHGDLWANNIMVKFENGKPVGTKIVDFQNTSLRSPVTDLLFFLWTSVQESILDRNLMDLIKYYHENFIQNLTQLGCDPTDFSFQDLLDEIKTDYKIWLSQTLFMSTFVVFGKKDGFSIDDPSKPPNFGTKDDITPEAKQRVFFVLKKCKEMGWL